MSTHHPTAADPHALLEDLGWLRRLARSLVRDPHLVDDLVQEACVVALGKGEAPRERRAWLTTVVRNLRNAHARREASRRLREQARQPGVADGAAALLVRAETQQALVAAVLQLEEPYRTAVLLRWFDGLPPRRIARRLTVPVATVRSRLQRALQQLRQRLDQDIGDRRQWALGLLACPHPLSGGTSLPPLILMQTKVPLTLVAAALTAALFTTPLWWPSPLDETESLASASPPAARHVGDDGTRDERSRSTQSSARQLAVPPPRPSAPAERVVHAIHGRVSDCNGQGLAGVRVGTAGDDLVTSDASGRFELSTTAPAASLRAFDDAYVTVLAGDWAEGATIAPIVVAARAVTLAGTVVEPTGVPIRGAQVRFVLPDDFPSRFSVPLDRAAEHGFDTFTDETGSFAFARLPAVAGAMLLVTADAFAPQRIEQPQHDDPNLRVVLPRFHYEDGQLEGVVLDPAGAPAPGARVAMGVTSVVTDRDGRFDLSLRRAGWPTAVVAAKAGHLPGRIEMPANGGKRREDWPELLILRLGPSPQSVAGRVVDEHGKAIPGAEVWIADPTPLGVAAVLPLQLEYLIAGGAVPPQVAAMRVPHADDPAQDGHDMDQTSVAKPSAGWFYVTADDDGSFVLPGLLDRPYSLRALDPRTGLFGDVANASGDSWQEIRITRGDLWPELRGRVVSRNGSPIAGVRVEQFVTAHRTTARVPGGRFVGTALRRGQVTTTAGDGSFVLRDVGRRFARFALSGDAIVPTTIEASAVLDPTRCRFEAEARCHVEVVLFDAAEADHVRCLDGAGSVVEIAVLRRNSSTFSTELALHDGRSGSFVVGELAATLELLRQGVAVRRIAFTPDPVTPTTLH